ncbi:MAG: hypothetical protein H6993_03725 [Pseudomonadales bacterium]|nr:hypothetical protein [Pseudomonadales bacterium]MCP5183043.1 hypothetical protein [Pseudomonadales bacterium]
MALTIDKPWRPADQVPQVPAQLGVFELADAAGVVVFIGVADARSLFGLRGAVADALQAVPGAAGFRYESTSAYHTRYRELLMVHQATHGALPVHNAPMQLGRLQP